MLPGNSCFFVEVSLYAGNKLILLPITATTIPDTITFPIKYANLTGNPKILINIFSTDQQINEQNRIIAGSSFNLFGKLK